MAIEILVPRLGWNMEEGVFHGWLKRDGDSVRAGEPIFTLEGDKAIQEIESTDAGVLRIAPNGPKEGDVVLVGAILGAIAQPGENVEFAQPSRRAPRKEAAATPETAPASVHAPSGRQAITPRARRAARTANVDWQSIRGTGRNGRIRERDILDAKGDAAASPLRRAIAAQMTRSAQATAPVTLTTTADATDLVKYRDALRSGAAAGPGITDLFVKLAALTLRRHPRLNARWQGDAIVVVPEIHIGIAVDTDAGLLVPVIRDAELLTLGEISARSRELADRARQRKLKAEELQGGTFTITNLGVFGIDAFTPIINLPECAILGIGRIARQPAVVDDEIVPRDLVTLSLTFDHRVLDGVPAAKFLQALAKGISDPATWLGGISK